MYLNAHVAKHYRAGLSARTVSQITGMAYRDVCRQFNELGRRADLEGLHNSRDLRRIAVRQAGMGTQDVAVSDTKSAAHAYNQCEMAEKYLAEQSFARRYQNRVSNPTICTLPVVLDIVTTGPLGRMGG